MDTINPVSQPEASLPVAPSAANPTTAGAIASQNSQGGPTTSTKISSMADLKREAPEMYNKMLESIGMKICHDMKDHQDRLKRLMREGNQR